MAKILTWRDDWMLRIDILDKDHRAIVDMLRGIARRFGEEPEQQEEVRQESGNQDSADSGDLYAALEKLGSYTRAHFQREEEFMRTIDYPHIADHRSEHAMLMAEHTALIRELGEREAERLGPAELEILKHWVVAHVIGGDRGFADHYFKICTEDSDQP